MHLPRLVTNESPLTNSQREKLMGNINNLRIKQQILVRLYSMGGIKPRTKEESIYRERERENGRKLSFCSYVTVSCRQPQASLSIVIAHDLSVCWATWPDSPDRAPTVSLHMPELSLRDTALSEGIHCTHEKQPKRIQPAQQRNAGLLHALKPNMIIQMISCFSTNIA